MKARVKATGEIFDFEKTLCSHTDGRKEYLWTSSETDYVFRDEELDFCIKKNIKHSPDYWTRLEHQYAGMAMQGILSNPNIVYKDISTETICNHVAERVKEIAHALVEKYKEKEERK